MKQNISKYASRTVGEIVADNYAAADVFHHFGVDFCCHGADNYLEAVGKANADPERVAAALDGLHVQLGMIFSVNLLNLVHQRKHLRAVATNAAMMACMRSRERPPILSNGRRIY